MADDKSPLCEGAFPSTPRTDEVMLRMDLKTKEFVLRLPGDKTAGHHVSIPNSEAGLAALARILHDRASAHSKGHQPRIGEDAAQTQYIIDQWMKEHTVRRSTRFEGDPELDEVLNSVEL